MRTATVVAMILAVPLGLAACETITYDPNSAASTDSCAFDSQCMSGNCEFGRCSPFSKAGSGGCRFDLDCGRLEECTAGSCSQVIGACDSDSDCSFGEECTGRHCWQKMNGCTFDSDCTSGSCMGGSCM